MTTLRSGDGGRGSANLDLQQVLDRVEGAGGKVLMPRTPVGTDAGYSALITDSEANTVGRHSQG